MHGSVIGIELKWKLFVLITIQKTKSIKVIKQHIKYSILNTQFVLTTVCQIYFRKKQKWQLLFTSGSQQVSTDGPFGKVIRE